MAKKKRSSPKKKGSRPKSGGTSKRKGGSSKPPAGLPGPGMLEGLMHQMFGDLQGGGGDSALDAAQELIYDAFEQSDPKKRARLARKALDLSPDCADAYVLLAELADGRKEALSLYEQAVAAGERALGPETFREDAGHFWGLLETRPYMRAREGLAHALWALGRREEAVSHVQDMLRLNPNDNQGLRYTLAHWLLALDRDKELAALLKRYDEDASAVWSYTAALLAFRRDGDSPASRKRLKEALGANSHVPTYLLGERPLPPEPPAYYSFGGDEEAVLYAADALSAWKSTPGAITWLRGLSEPKAPKKPSKGAGKTRMPSAAAKKRLASLPQGPDPWLVEVRELPSWVENDDGERVRPWATLVINPAGGPILAVAVSDVEPGPGDLWEVLDQAMRTPMAGEPGRPAALHVRPEPRWDAVRPQLEAIGVPLVETGELDLLDMVFADLVEHLSADEPPGLLDMPGVTPELAAGFYQAAAEFYRKAPWKRLGYEEAIKIACDRFESGPWYAVVMGQSGLTLGLALYEDFELLRKMWDGRFSDEESARETVGLTVTFDVEADVPPEEVEAIQEHGWELAGPEAYPTVFRKERGLITRPPLSWELELLEGCLRALPAFIAKYRPGDTEPHRMTVPVGAGDLTLELSWVEEA